MAEIYFTIAGTNHHHGQDFLEAKDEGQTGQRTG